MRKHPIKVILFAMLVVTHDLAQAGTWVGVLLFRDPAADHVHMITLDADHFTDKAVPAYGEVMDICALDNTKPTWPLSQSYTATPKCESIDVYLL